MITAAERKQMPPIYSHPRPDVPDDLTGATEAQLHDWRTALVLVMQSVQAQIVSRDAAIAHAGGLPNMPREEAQEYHRWRRVVALFQAGAQMDLRRLKNEMHQRSIKENAKKSDWRRLTGDLAEALRNDPAVSLATRHAATVLARAIEGFYAEGQS